MKERRKIRMPHTFVIIFSLIVFSAIVTFFVPGGEFSKDTGEFAFTNSVPQSWHVLTAFYKGFTKQAGIIVFILVIGASFWVVNSCKAIDAGIYSFLEFTKGLEKYKAVKRVGSGNIIIVLIMLLFSIFGAVFGMSEETIAFTIIIVPLAISLGYDSIVGIAMVYVAAHVGFAGAVLNPFTIGIAQDIAGLPIFSGIEYRLICWVVLNVITIGIVLWYAARVRRDPSKSPVYIEDDYWRSKIDHTQNEKIEYNTPKGAWIIYWITLIIFSIFSFYYPHTEIKIGNRIFDVPYLIPLITLFYAYTSFKAIKKSVHFFVLNMLFFTIIVLITGVMGYGWYIGEISALFLALGIFSGIAAGYSGNEIVTKLVEGSKDILSAALVVALAAGIIVILEDGRVVDTLLYYMSGAMKSAGKEVSLGVMYLIQTATNIVIPSASAKAAITMPIMAPFSDLIGVSRQATVLAFQFGDGFTNMITPTSGILIAVLTIARVPYSKWFKLVLPFIAILVLVGFLLLLPTLYLKLNGF